MSSLFGNHSYFSRVYKHEGLPVYMTSEFSFYRCVNVEEWVYGKTISTLHAGNLRSNDNQGRYSRLFPNEKISYWADSKETAVSEIRKHKGNNNYLTFTAYDDLSSTIPILDNDESLVIIDGRDSNFHEILLKIEEKGELATQEAELVESIKHQKPDCLAYKSIARKGGVNFLFFEKGFKKLALRHVQLYFGERKSKNTEVVSCAGTSDYMPYIDNYGYYFEPIVKIKMDNDYKNTKEYELRYKNKEKSWRRFTGR